MMKRMELTGCSAPPQRFNKTKMKVFDLLMCLLGLAACELSWIGDCFLCGGLWAAEQPMAPPKGDKPNQPIQQSERDWSGMEWMKWRKAALEWNQLWIKWIIDGRERAPLPPSLNERNGAQPKLPKQRGKLKWNPIKRISLFAFDGWNGRVGLALLGWVSGCRCSQWLRPIKRPAQPNNPSRQLFSLFFLSSL